MLPSWVTSESSPRPPPAEDMVARLPTTNDAVLLRDGKCMEFGTGVELEVGKVKVKVGRELELEL